MYNDNFCCCLRVSFKTLSSFGAVLHLLFCVPVWHPAVPHLQQRGWGLGQAQEIQFLFCNFLLTHTGGKSETQDNYILTSTSSIVCNKEAEAKVKHNSKLE